MVTATMRDKIAVHEAGHAVAAIVNGHSIRTATIEPDRESDTAGRIVTYLGRRTAERAGVTVETPEDEKYRRLENVSPGWINRSVRVLLGGIVAERVVMPDFEANGVGGESDLDAIRTALAAAGLSPSENAFHDRWDRLEAETKAVIQDNAAALKRLVAELLRRGTLTGDECYGAFYGGRPRQHTVPQEREDGPIPTGVVCGGVKMPSAPIGPILKQLSEQERGGA